MDYQNVFEEEVQTKKPKLNLTYDSYAHGTTKNIIADMDHLI